MAQTTLRSAHVTNLYNPLYSAPKAKLKAAPLRVFKLAHIAEADFRKSALHQFLNLHGSKRNLLTNGQIIVLFAKTRSKVRFLLDYRDIVTARGKKTKAFAFEQVDLGKGRWNRAMLGDYAKMRGIKIEGVKPFEDMWKTFEKTVVRLLREESAEKAAEEKKAARTAKRVATRRATVLRNIRR